jgi:hypothetical protein
MDLKTLVITFLFGTLILSLPGNSQAENVVSLECALPGHAYGPGPHLVIDFDQSTVSEQMSGGKWHKPWPAKISADTVTFKDDANARRGFFQDDTLDLNTLIWTRQWYGVRVGTETLKCRVQHK